MLWVEVTLCQSLAYFLLPPQILKASSKTCSFIQGPPPGRQLHQHPCMPSFQPESQPPLGASLLGDWAWRQTQTPAHSTDLAQEVPTVDLLKTTEETVELLPNVKHSPSGKKEYSLSTRG